MTGADSKAAVPPLPDGINPVASGAVAGVVAVLAVLAAVAVPSLTRDVT